MQSNFSLIHLEVGKWNFKNSHNITKQLNLRGHKKSLKKNENCYKFSHDVVFFFSRLNTHSKHQQLQQQQQQQQQQLVEELLLLVKDIFCFDFRFLRFHFILKTPLISLKSWTWAGFNPVSELRHSMIGNMKIYLRKSILRLWWIG